jgi:endonuclease-3
MLLLSLEEVTESIQSINYYKNKAKYLKWAAELLVDKWDSQIPKTVSEMMELSGVGIKTAKVVLSVLYGLPLVWVDTHIHRVCNRIGLLKSTSPLETDKIIDKKFTQEQKTKMHHPFVLFGRYMCTAARPKCSQCPLAQTCNYITWPKL